VIRRETPAKLFLVVPLQFFAPKAQLVVLMSAFVMVSTVWSVYCFLFFYSRCPPCPAIRKSGGHVPPCPTESAPLLAAVQADYNGLWLRADHIFVVPYTCAHHCSTVKRDCAVRAPVSRTAHASKLLAPPSTAYGRAVHSGSACSVCVCVGGFTVVGLVRYFVGVVEACVRRLCADGHLAAQARVSIQCRRFQRSRVACLPKVATGLRPNQQLDSLTPAAVDISRLLTLAR